MKPCEFKNMKLKKLSIMNKVTDVYHCNYHYAGMLMSWIIVVRFLHNIMCKKKIFNDIMCDIFYVAKWDSQEQGDVKMKYHITWHGNPCKDEK